MKTAELTSAELDYWVAMAEGWTWFRNKRDGITVTRPDGSIFNAGDCANKFDPDTGEKLPLIMPADALSSYGDIRYQDDWSLAGPIIERERIDVFITPSPNQYEVREYRKWMARAFRYAPARPTEKGIKDASVWKCGPTHLIAAMRAYVASKFGEEVPDTI